MIRTKKPQKLRRPQKWEGSPNLGTQCPNQYFFTSNPQNEDNFKQTHVTAICRISPFILEKQHSEQVYISDEFILCYTKIFYPVYYGSEVI